MELKDPLVYLSDTLLVGSGLETETELNCLKFSSHIIIRQWPYLVLSLILLIDSL